MATSSQTSTPSSSSPPPPPPEHDFYRVTDRKTKQLRTAFAVYPKDMVAGRRTLTPAPANALEALHEAQIKRMDPTGARTALFAKTLDAAHEGDVLMVTHRRGGEPFAGVCLSIRRRGIDTAVLLRNHLGKVGVEMWYKVYNKNVAGVEIVKRRLKRPRRARLTYMRKPKHDMGSVEDLVFEWKRSRKVFSSAKTAAGAAANGASTASGGGNGGDAGAAGKKN
ncbi:eb3eaa9a-b7c8-4ea7-8812-8393b6596dc2 [Thermothielavioides terrestris]|uniref:Eb3eaa9a-b7c8-4ea7-8812-8393b6596dc2 n=1 Tax=Thermothielavioides terrestris TaxID=2587410 RepID=A0A3S4F6E4_9PEZI|nr:eb3eaa9a-b7c8-4ea7-8812-8393b6596dc2 [Thermothielavioides terrestris]